LKTNNIFGISLCEKSYLKFSARLILEDWGTSYKMPGPVMPDNWEVERGGL
jgi:hypothetical protein